MHVAPKKKAPKPTRPDMWRRWLTYLFLLLTALFAARLVWRIWYRHSLLDISITAGLTVLLVLWFVIQYRRTAAVNRDRLYAFVAHTLGHHVGNLFRSVDMAKLTHGQGGWIHIDDLRTDRGDVIVGLGKQLQDHPCGSDPTLIVLAEDGRYHLFRFTSMEAMPLEEPPDTLNIQLVDHGVVGPNRFDKSMWEAGKPERSAP
jgi:hypothetical protein